MAYGGPVLRSELDAMGLDPKDVIVTDLDSDFRVHRQYFANITHHYVTDPKRLECIFQPVPMFHNNLWRVPFAVRIMASACTQWQMFLSSRPDRLVAFSSYSMSMDLVIKAGYWDDDVIPEDSRFYWKAFFATSGRLKVVPVFLPIYGDAPEASDRGVLREVWAYAQLGLYRPVGLVFSVLPALEAQTRLMLGMYLEYKVTEKVAEGTMEGTA